MDVSQPPFSEEGNSPSNVSVSDPPLQPTPDYGTLGPGSDIKTKAADRRQRSASNPRLASVLAGGIGVFLALVVASLSTAHAGWSHFRNIFSVRREASARTPTPANVVELENMRPQKQAEALLELAVAHSHGAADQISSRVARWQGKLQWDSQMATLTTAALNSNDVQVRQSGIEVELAAYGLAKDAASLQYLLKSADSTDHAKKIWALWALGLLGNRGVDRPRVLEVLTAHLNDADPESRHWTVEGLSIVGAKEVIPLLLTAMHDDPSPVVREAAACGIAQSGMFSREQRMSALPQLLNYAEDPTLDAQTRGWAFQALADITGRRLPNDAAAWRSWYENRN
jgi:HEAT repeats